MQMPLKLFPDDIIGHYNLCERALNSYVYMEIWRSMYGLPQVGILANKPLRQFLGQHGYFEVQHPPGLWKHVSKLIKFNLWADNFGVKYIGNGNLKHFFSVLRTEMYKIVDDWDGNLYCSINLRRNYGKHLVDIAMPVYAIKNPTRLNHLPLLKSQHCLYRPNPITCMVKAIKQQLLVTPVHSLMCLARSAYNKLSVVSYTTRARSTLPY
jgi:hypothetical protein